MYLTINQVFIVLRAAAFSARGPGLVCRPTLGPCPVISAHYGGGQGTGEICSSSCHGFYASHRPPAQSGLITYSTTVCCLLDSAGVLNFDRSEFLCGYEIFANQRLQLYKWRCKQMISTRSLEVANVWRVTGGRWNAGASEGRVARLHTKQKQPHLVTLCSLLGIH